MSGCEVRQVDGQGSRGVVLSEVNLRPSGHGGASP